MSNQLGWNLNERMILTEVHTQNILVADENVAAAEILPAIDSMDETGGIERVRRSSEVESEDVLRLNGGARECIRFSRPSQSRATDT